MPLILPGNVGSATAAAGFNVANSARFNKGSSDSLTRTQSASPTHDDKGTLSFWFKRSLLGVDQYVFSVFQDSNNRMQMNIKDDDQLKLLQKTGGSTVISLITNRLFRDVSAWYHVVVAIDTTQGTASNRIKIYINGVQETSFGTETYPDQNENVFLTKGTAVSLGAYNSGSGDHTSAYFSEIVMVDGQQLAADQFGEFDSDSGIWKPIDVSELTFGTNGYYLDFEDSGDLGDDESGNGNDFTENNLAATDQSTDTCTNNFCTLNSLDNFFAGSTLAEGNCKVTYLSGSGKYGYNTGTIALTSGKWYHEIKIVQSAGSNYNMFGIEEDVSQSAGHEFLSSSTGYVLNGNNGKIIVTGTDTTYGDATAVNDIIGVYVDLDNNKIYFAENGTVMNSGTGQTIAAASATKHGYYFVIGGDYSGGTVGIHEFNFGGSPAFTVSSGNTDDNGYGNFEYSPNITGDSVAKKFYAICTKNLAEYG